MTAQETFEFAAAIAGVSIGLAAVLVLAIMAIIGTWRLFRVASDASLASTRAMLSVEELARHLTSQPRPTAPPEEGTQFAELRQEAEALLSQQQRLQEMARNLIDAEALEGRETPAAIEDIYSAVGRLDATVGQMAASLANLIQLMERREEQ